MGIAVPVLTAGRAATIPAWRLGLFVIIVLGEGVLQLALYVWRAERVAARR